MFHFSTGAVTSNAFWGATAGGLYANLCFHWTAEDMLTSRAFLFSLGFLEYYMSEEGCIMCRRAMVGAVMLSESRLCWLLNQDWVCLKTISGSFGVYFSGAVRILSFAALMYCLTCFREYFDDDSLVLMIIEIEFLMKWIFSFGFDEVFPSNALKIHDRTSYQAGGGLFVVLVYEYDLVSSSVVTRMVGFVVVSVVSNCH